VPVTVLVPHEVAERCYLSEALLWAAFSRLPLELLNNQPDTREEGSDFGYFAQSPEIEPVTLEECNRVGLPPRPVWKSAYSHLSQKHLRSKIALERSEEKKNELRKAFFEAEEFQSRLTEWEGKLGQFTEQFRFKLLQALQKERFGATGKRLPCSTIEASLNLMDKETEGYSQAQYVDREPIPPDFWSSAEIDWGDSLAEGVTKGCAVAYGLILVEVAQLLKEFPLPNGEEYGGVSKAGDYLVLTSQDEIRGGPKQGRPSFNWVEFHLEMARRVRDGLLPSKKRRMHFGYGKVVCGQMETECGQKHSGAKDQAVLRQICTKVGNSGGLTF